MIEIKEGVLEKIKDWSDESIYIVADFDRTLTKSTSEASWGILSKNKLTPKEYTEERKKLYDYYYPLEIDNTISETEKNKLMKQWWTKHISLFIKYKLPENIVEDSAKNHNVMEFRPGVKQFLEKMYQKKIPVIIISAGIGNFIKSFLINNNCYHNNIYIVSNFIEFKDGIASGIIGNIIHSSNKDEASLDPKIHNLIKNKSNIVLLGDSISDVKMVPINQRNKALKICFINPNSKHRETFKDTFDVICDDNADYREIFKKLNILK